MRSTRPTDIWMIDGEYTGFDLELAQAVCDLEGWELVEDARLTGTPKDMELNSGSIDCIWNGFTMTWPRGQTTRSPYRMWTTAR